MTTTLTSEIKVSTETMQAVWYDRIGSAQEVLQLGVTMEGAVANLLQTGQLTAAIAKHYPLAETAAAHDAVDRGKVIGNIIVDID